MMTALRTRLTEKLRSEVQASIRAVNPATSGEWYFPCVPADLAFPVADEADRALSARSHTTVRPFVEFLALRTSHPPPCRDAAVGPIVIFLALRTSHRPPCRDAAVRPIVVFLALRTSHRPPCRDAAVRPIVVFLALRASLGRRHPSQPNAFVFQRNEYLAGRTVALRCRGGRNEIRPNNHCDEHEANAKTQGCFPTDDAPPH
jgi:hypothetical protein